MQILQTLIAAAIAIAAIVIVLAEQEAHLRVRVHDKFYVTPLGMQCAFNNCIDPSMYPCAKSTCVRLNYTYGKCTKDSSDNPEQQDLDDPKLLCPYPNPYNSKLGSLDDDEDDDNTESQK
ncbi:RxLR-like protein [Plasmopara halstedii]|uniref:RxLR-like protein n=1 Tax=Plasmopara halstedii TaxID=4781 RepID=A0A0P1A8R8_PLAHL|nr:RxLR-like protein [Plasmopara halstedii]CEG36729.1 RxLR-like protein [Plasmopara halstedii]|eukprot:XP_024573098.1 RxLR-like protein [Plasmopara halstedii]